jgi:hypothetical protein
VGVGVSGENKVAAATANKHHEAQRASNPLGWIPFSGNNEFPTTTTTIITKEHEKTIKQAAVTK